MPPGKKRGREDEAGADQSPAGKLCGNGHPLVLVPKEVRRLEKEESWSCDGTDCQLDWDGESLFPDRQRLVCTQKYAAIMHMCHAIIKAIPKIA